MASLTPFEFEIMRVLGEVGSASVETVRSRLTRRPEPAYTTVQTMLNILHRKGKVTRERVGRAFVYAPAAGQKRAMRRVLRDLLDRLLGGSAEDLVVTLIQTRQLSDESLARIQKELDEHRQGSSKENRHGRN